MLLKFCHTGEFSSRLKLVKLVKEPKKQLFYKLSSSNALEIFSNIVSGVVFEVASF